MSYRQMADISLKYEKILPAFCELFQALQCESGVRVATPIDSRFRFEVEGSHAWAMAKDAFERDHDVSVEIVHVPGSGFYLQAVRP